MAIMTIDIETKALFEKALAAKVACRHVDEEHSLREYLCELLQTLWIKGDWFDGKRPFGDSDWQEDVYAALVQCGAVPGEIDDEGFIKDGTLDGWEAEKFMFSLIRYMCDVPDSEWKFTRR